MLVTDDDPIARAGFARPLSAAGYLFRSSASWESLTAPLEPEGLRARWTDTAQPGPRPRKLDVICRPTAEGHEHMRRKLNVMVIDDDAPIRRLLRRMLEGEGYAVLEAANGRFGLDHLDRRRIDLVITDVYMPDLNGFEFVMRIRDRYPDTRIIVMSGGGEVAKAPILSAAERLGAHRVIEKPFDPEDMLEAVAQMLASDESG